VDISFITVQPVEQKAYGRHHKGVATIKLAKIPSFPNVRATDPMILSTESVRITTKVLAPLIQYLDYVITGIKRDYRSLQ
jgi:hypothetical protein